MFKVGDAIKWMCPLDNDYTYGEITALRKSVATVKGTGLYSGITAVSYTHLTLPTTPYV